jgi:hypothetical protein
VATASLLRIGSELENAPGWRSKNTPVNECVEDVDLILDPPSVFLLVILSRGADIETENVELDLHAAVFAE